MLLEALRTAAVHRSLWPAEGTYPLGPEDVFALVRDMPYKRASNREPITTIQEWRGTCSGKHYLLKALFAELGHTSTLMACTQYIAPKLAMGLPEEVQNLFSAGPIPDVHNYLKLHTQHGTMTIDATWPRGAERLGLLVNEEFVWGTNMQLACRAIHHFEVPEEVDPQVFKEELLHSHFSPEEIARREAFFRVIAG